jgi:uncharacterized membrane protein YebE (DUF533 family)
MHHMDVEIGRDTLIALAAVAWADGKIEASEAAGIRSAAQQLGLGEHDLRAVEETLRRPVPLEEVETIRMNRLTRLFTYAVAVWIAEIDGAVPPPEEAALNLLGERLGLSGVARDRAKSAGVAEVTAAGAAQDLDLLKLRSRLSVGLSQIGNE